MEVVPRAGMSDRTSFKVVGWTRRNRASVKLVSPWPKVGGISAREVLRAAGIRANVAEVSGRTVLKKEILPCKEKVGREDAVVKGVEAEHPRSDSIEVSGREEAKEKPVDVGTTEKESVGITEKECELADFLEAAQTVREKEPCQESGRGKKRRGRRRSKGKGAEQAPLN